MTYIPFSKYMSHLTVGFLLILTNALSAFTDKAAIEIDFEGNSLAIWQCNTPEGSCIQAATSSASCPQWSCPQTISSRLENADGPVLALNGCDAVVIWRAIRRPYTPTPTPPSAEETEYRTPLYTDYYLAAAIYHNGEWSRPKIISACEERILPDYQVKINEWRLITAIWNCFPDCCCGKSEIHAAKADAWIGPCSWTPPVKISN